MKNLLALTLAALAFTKPPQPAMNDKVLWIMLDDVGRDTLLATMRSGHLPTLASFAQQGARYWNFYGAPACSPARARALTGLYAHRQGNRVGSVIQRKHGGLHSMPWNEALPHQLVNPSSFVGKWHLASTDFESIHPQLCGFADVWHTPYNVGPDGGSYYDGQVAYKNGALNPWTGYVTDVVAAKALERVAVYRDSFVFASFHSMHKPYEVPPDGSHTYDGLTYDGSTDYELALAMLEAADTAMAPLINAALDNGYTVLIFSDNGMSGNHGGEKGSVSEAGMRTWLLARGPDVVAGPRSQLVEATDLYATTTDIINGTPTETGDCWSFKDSLSDPTAWHRNFLFAAKFKPNGEIPPAGSWTRGLRNDRWKIVWDPGGLVLQPTHFYDLQNDKDEKNNLLTDTLTKEQQDALTELLALHP